MYCSKCGKEIDYDALVCRECEQAEQKVSLVDIQPPEEPLLIHGNPRKRGFGKALAGVIVGFVATMVSVIIYMAGLVSLTAAIEMGQDIGGMAAGFLFSEALVIIPSIIAIVFGARSVKVFKTTPPSLPKPIATLVVGIHSIFFGGFAMLYTGIFVFMLTVMALAA